MNDKDYEKLINELENGIKKEKYKSIGIIIGYFIGFMLSYVGFTILMTQFLELTNLQSLFVWYSLNWLLSKMSGEKLK